MTTRVNIKVEGAQKLLSDLKRLEQRIERNIVYSALRASVTVARNAIRGATYSTVSRRTGLLRSGMGIKRVKRPRPDIKMPTFGVYAVRGTKSVVNAARKAGTLRRYKVKREPGKTREVNVPFYWRFIEFGTSRATAKPYIGRAFGSVASEMNNVFRSRVQAGIERAARR